ncbi:PQQ-dependent sugar dehydrogenase [Myxococcota bacterium]|nr:PQQ-dependent sugar dehydrogenase [Myxococcota bacterium]
MLHPLRIPRPRAPGVSVSGAFVLFAVLVAACEDETTATPPGDDPAPQRPDRDAPPPAPDATAVERDAVVRPRDARTEPADTRRDDGPASPPDGAGVTLDAVLPPADAPGGPIDGAAPAADGRAPMADAPGAAIEDVRPPADGSAPPDAGSAPPADGSAPADAGRPPPPRVENRTCRIPDAGPAGPLTVSEAFPALDFTAPLWIGHAGTGERRLFVAEQGGLIRSFEPREDADATDVFLRVDTRANGELGLLGLAFHPNHAENGLFYVFSSRENPTRSRISEFRRIPGDPPVADPDSERVLLEFEKPFGNHNGGDLHFGPDGYLYVAVGDGGSAGDPQNHAQRPETLLGSILRIDVDRRDPGLEYAVPADNPFAGCTPDCGALGPARPEVWAYGLRNPWRMSFDPPTGRLFAGDVGQGAWEEVDLIRGGENYGWRRLEGNDCYEAADCDPTGTTLPVHAYPRAEGQSIIGGRVYRGGAFPELWGAYIFGDNRSGRLWALREVDGRAENVTLLADTDLQLTSFGVDTDETLYLTAYNARRSLFRLARPADAPPVAPLPQRLSETGCFADVAAHAPAPGVVPYAVTSALYSDGALEYRAFALPEGGRFVFRDGQSWDAPNGSVVLKTFAFATPEGGERRVETRVMARGADGWQGYSYRWRADQSDADLLPGAEDALVEGPDSPICR